MLGIGRGNGGSRSNVYVRKQEKEESQEQFTRFLVLLAMGIRILARIWSEEMGLLDVEQAGFRKCRSTADVTQIMYRIQEDGEDLKKRLERVGETIQEDDKPSARLLDPSKAYLRVNEYAMWKIHGKYGMGEGVSRQ